LRADPMWDPRRETQPSKTDRRTAVPPPGR
jgi:hypothetical protein